MVLTDLNPLIPFKAQVELYKVQNGGMTKTKKLVQEWFNDIKDDKNATNVQEIRMKLLPGHIYTFKYDPVHKLTLPFYDKAPLILHLGTIITKEKKMLDVGINLNFFPYNTKIWLIEKILKAYKKPIYTILNRKNKTKDAKKEKHLTNFNYIEVCKKLLKDKANFFIRSYYPSHRKKTYIFSYEEWLKIIFMPQKYNEIVKEPITEIHRQYKEFVKKLKK